MKKVFLAALFTASVGPLQAADPPKNAFALIRQARAAYDRGDKAAFLNDYEEAARLRPGDVWILYNLACAQALIDGLVYAEGSLVAIQNGIEPHPASFCSNSHQAARRSHAAGFSR